MNVHELEELAEVSVNIQVYAGLTLAGIAAVIWAVRRDAHSSEDGLSFVKRSLRRCPTPRSKCQTVASPPKASDAEGVSFPALSNAELGDLWAQVCRTYALKRTGSSRDFWRKLLDEPDMIEVRNEYRRRALERQEEYDAWLQYVEAST